jgi:ParB-like chromosome segregation protein Spo0J
MNPVYEFHPLAAIFPVMAEPEIADLAADIKTNGLRVPIVLYQGKILDGRNRYRACDKAEVEPQFVEYEGDQPIQYVLSLNLRRRHLTTSQKATVAADLANIHREDTLIQNRSDARKQATVRISQEDAAAMVGVSRTTVQDAVSLKRTDDLLYKQVQAGKMTLRQAIRRAHPQKYKRQRAWVAQWKADEAAHKGADPQAEAELEPDTLDKVTCINSFKEFVVDLSQGLRQQESEIMACIKAYLIQDQPPE